MEPVWFFSRTNKKVTTLSAYNICVASSTSFCVTLTELRLFQAQRDDSADHPVFGKVSLQYAKCSNINSKREWTSLCPVPVVVAEWFVLPPLSTLSHYSLSFSLPIVLFISSSFAIKKNKHSCVHTAFYEMDKELIFIKGYTVVLAKLVKSHSCVFLVHYMYIHCSTDTLRIYKKEKITFVKGKYSKSGDKSVTAIKVPCSLAELKRETVGTQRGFNVCHHCTSRTPGTRHLVKGKWSKSPKIVKLEDAARQAFTGSRRLATITNSKDLLE